MRVRIFSSFSFASSWPEEAAAAAALVSCIFFAFSAAAFSASASVIFRLHLPWLPGLLLPLLPLLPFVFSSCSLLHFRFCTFDFLFDVFVLFLYSVFDHFSICLIDHTSASRVHVSFLCSHLAWSGLFFTFGGVTNFAITHLWSLPMCITSFASASRLQQ